MVSLQFKHWVFKPEIIPTIVFLLGFPLLLSLGCWQLHRAEEKRQLLGQYSLRIQQSPVPIKGHEPDYTPVSVTGYYDNQRTLFWIIAFTIIRWVTKSFRLLSRPIVFYWSIGAGYLDPAIFPPCPQSLQSRANKRFMVS